MEWILGLGIGDIIRSASTLHLIQEGWRLGLRSNLVAASSNSQIKDSATVQACLLIRDRHSLDLYLAAKLGRKWGYINANSGTASLNYATSAVNAIS